MWGGRGLNRIFAACECQNLTLCIMGGTTKNETDVFISVRSVLKGTNMLIVPLPSIGIGYEEYLNLSSRLSSINVTHLNLASVPMVIASTDHLTYSTHRWCTYMRM